MTDKYDEDRRLSSNAIRKIVKNFSIPDNKIIVTTKHEGKPFEIKLSEQRRIEKRYPKDSS